MIFAAPAVDLPSQAPQIVAPAPHEVSFGRVVATLPRGTSRVLVLVNGRRAASRPARGLGFRAQLSLPLGDSSIRIVALDRAGRRRSSAPIGPVYGLPRAALPRRPAAFEEPGLTRTIEQLARSFRGTAAVYVQDLRTGAGAAWNARARFPAGSTLKLAIAIEALRTLRGPPAPGSRLDRLLRAALVHSDNRAANELEVWFGGSTSGGSARVNATLRALGLHDTDMYGGFIVETASVMPPIPVRVESQPEFPRGKHSTAWDLVRLVRLLHEAAGGRGELVRRFEGTFTPAAARYLLYLLCHSADYGKLDRFLGNGVAVAHKAGWIETARHDVGLVYWPGGAFVVAVLTWNANGAGVASDVLAGRVARAALLRLQELEPRPPPLRAPVPTPI